MKMERGFRYESSVSLNWLLNKDCKIRRNIMFLAADFDGDCPIVFGGGHEKYD